MVKKIIQLQDVSPEGYKNEIVNDILLKVRLELSQFSEKNQPKKEEELITSKEACKILKITLPTLYDWRKKGIVIAYRIANKIRFKRSEIENSLTKINE